jgi:hypothetical protein
MKKLLVVAALFASVMAASAQQFGVKGGLTLSTVGGAPKDNKAVALYEAGVVYKADLGGGFAIQPALGYQMKGAKFQQDKAMNQNNVETKTGYVELSVGAQWGPDLLAFRPYFFVEPYIGYAVTGDEKLINQAGTLDKKTSAALPEAKNKLEFGAGAGIGLEIAYHIQLSCQIFNNFGKLYKEDKLDNGDLKGIKSSYIDLKNYQGVKLTLAVLF